MAHDIILHLDMVQDHTQLTDEEKDLRKVLKLRVQGLAAVERSHRRQCSRLTWLKEGDACTKIFHLKANARRLKNFISSLMAPHGLLLWSHEEKEGEVLRNFRKSLGTKEPRTCTFNWAGLELDPVLVSGLDDAFTEQEICAAIS